jgi:hypothetical protein
MPEVYPGEGKHLAFRISQIRRLTKLLRDNRKRVQFSLSYGVYSFVSVP